MSGYGAMRRSASRLGDAARKGAVKVRILGGNTVAGRIGRRWENRSAAIIASTPTIIVVWVLLPLAFYGLLWYSLIADTDEYWPALLALCVAYTITNLKLVFGFWMDLTLLKFCYQHIVSWLNLVNVLRWSVAFLLCRGGTATNVVFVVTMCFFVFVENASDAVLGMNLGKLLGYVALILAYCTTLYLMSTQRTWREEEFMPEREVNVFGNTTFSYTVDLRETHNSALLQLIFFVAADGYAYLKMAYKLRTFNAPPYRSVRIKVPLHLDEYHEWGMRIDDPKLVKRFELQFPRRAPVRTTSGGTATVVVAAEAARHLRAAEHPHAVELGGGADPQLRVEEAGLHEGLGGERGGERGGCVAGRGMQGGGGVQGGGTHRHGEVSGVGQGGGR